MKSPNRGPAPSVTPEEQFAQTLLTHDPKKILQSVVSAQDAPVDLRDLGKLYQQYGLGNVTVKAPHPDGWVGATNPADPYSVKQFDYVKNDQLNELDHASGVTLPRKGGGITTIIDRYPRPSNKGVNDVRETAMHEMTHAYLMNRLGMMEYRNPEQKNKAVDGFMYYLDRFKSGMYRYKPKHMKNNVGLHELARNPDEAIAWVLTDKELQDYMKTVDVDGHALDTENPVMSAFDHIANWANKHLGFDLRRHSAYEALDSHALNVVRTAGQMKPSDAAVLDMLKRGVPLAMDDDDYQYRPLHQNTKGRRK
jgi:hypothetical protein